MVPESSECSIIMIAVIRGHLLANGCFFFVTSPDQSLIPLKYLWSGVLTALLIMPDLQDIPISILKGILQPGSLSNVRALLL